MKDKDKKSLPSECMEGSQMCTSPPELGEASNRDLDTCS